jgi:pimeloyl-ACP methyl ester carboxylesterase
MDQLNLILPDGRNLEVITAGTPSSSAILFHHGTPGSCNTWEEWLPVVEELGGYAIAFSRAGYGSSARKVDRSVISNSEDSKAILEHFGVSRSVSIGWSGGGPHCLADTTLVQNVAAISIAGVAEFGTGDLDFLEGMGEENHIEFGAAIAGSEVLEAWMKDNYGGTANVTGEELIEALGGLIGDADKKSLTTEVAAVVASEFRHALAAGYYGWMDDDIAFVAPWGFDITKIKKPVELWQGDEDFMVPHAHGKWLAGKIPTAKLIFEPGEGHISLGINKRSAIIGNALGYLSV